MTYCVKCKFCERTNDIALYEFGLYCKLDLTLVPDLLGKLYMCPLDKKENANG